MFFCFGSGSSSLFLTLLLCRFVCLSNGGLNFLHRICLDDVTLGKVTEVDDRDPALIAGGNFLHLILEAAQRVDLSVEQFDIVAQDTDLGVALDLAL